MTLAELTNDQLAQALREANDHNLAAAERLYSLEAFEKNIACAMISLLMVPPDRVLQALLATGIEVGFKLGRKAAETERLEELAGL